MKRTTRKNPQNLRVKKCAPRKRRFAESYPMVLPIFWQVSTTPSWRLLMKTTPPFVGLVAAPAASKAPANLPLTQRKLLRKMRQKNPKNSVSRQSMYLWKVSVQAANKPSADFPRLASTYFQSLIGRRPHTAVAVKRNQGECNNFKFQIFSPKPKP